MYLSHIAVSLPLFLSSSPPSKNKQNLLKNTKKKRKQSLIDMWDHIDIPTYVYKGVPKEEEEERGVGRKHVCYTSRTCNTFHQTWRFSGIIFFKLQIEKT